MSLCNGCGDCCDPVVTTWTKKEVARRVAEESEGNNNAVNLLFIRKHWRRISKSAFRGRQAGEKGIYFWRCDQFNPATRRCMAYENRPPVCRDFPWYGKEPHQAALAGLKRCGYWLWFR